MAVQMARRIHEKIVTPGFDQDSIEAEIMMALIEAEQVGNFTESLYELAGEYEGYETATDIYSLWISP